MKTTELLNGKKGDCGSPLRSVRNDSDNSVRKDRVFFLLLTFLFLFCTGLHAQVTIGGLTEPQKGAILDLNSNVKGGLVLSNVTITNVDSIPHNAASHVFQGINSTNEDVNMELRGAMVYNDGNGTTVPPGVYIWNGHCWTNDGRDFVVNPPAITVDGDVKSSAVATEGSSTAVALAVASPQSDVSYEWYQNTTAFNSDGTPISPGETYITPDDLLAGPHYYYCKATSLSCPSVNAVSEVITVTVKPDLANLTSGNGTLTGPACFDVAKNNSGGNCGALSNRTSNQRIFTDAPTEVYTFTLTGHTGLSFDFRNLDVDYPVIKSLNQSGNTVTVTFNTGLDNWASGRIRAQALKAELYAVYNTNQKTMLTLSVSDCQCCPGLLVVGGEYSNIAATPNLPSGYNSDPSRNGSAAEAVISAFTNKTGYNLCYYKRDANSSSSPTGSPSTYRWNTTDGTLNAMNVCQTTQGVDAVDAHSDWRLPNLAELAQIGQLVSSYTSQAINTGVGSQEHVNAAIRGNTGQSDVIALPGGSNTTTGTYNLLHSDYYWSSTEYGTNYAWYWDFNPSSRNAFDRNKTGSNYVRCVRRF